MSANVITDSNWKSAVLEAKGPVLVYFSAKWCGPCRVLAPVVEKLADELTGKVKVCKVDIEESPNAATSSGVRSLPTVMVFDGGVCKAQHVGPMIRQSLLNLVREATDE